MGLRIDSECGSVLEVTVEGAKATKVVKWQEHHRMAGVAL